ncbi:MAG: hypothetical protein DCC50_02095 [Acidobacteria bacterium]|nr:MAG: hypothetical protein DCC50_02095 [Acidobacteriota bacterium]
MQPLTDLPPAVLRALEDLLRRVLRAPHDVDVAVVRSGAQELAAVRRQRRQARAVLLVLLGAALVLTGWFSAALVG